MNVSYRIALLFNANKVYDRQVIEGIGRYLQSSPNNWSIFIEDTFVYDKNSIDMLCIDGIIADFDDQETIQSLKQVNIPIVAVGGSYQDISLYPHFPYVATDNYALIEMAFNHLKQKGITHFAFYGLPCETEQHWAKQRENAFIQLMQKNEHSINIYLGELFNSQNWFSSLSYLREWLKSLPVHTGIIAVTDARARHLLQACEDLHIAIPEQICIIGIDNEELIQYLSRVSLSSVLQGTKQLGYQAAKLLHRLLDNRPIDKELIIIPPLKVEERQSTDYRCLKDPFVIQAMHYIRHHACDGIKVEQVLEHIKISRSNLEARFKKETNQTIHQVIHSEKMERAKRLLTQTDISIQEVSESCGYPSLQYFYSAFKKDQHKTPKEFREALKNSCFSS